MVKVSVAASLFTPPMVKVSSVMSSPLASATIVLVSSAMLTAEPVKVAL